MKLYRNVALLICVASLFLTSCAAMSSFLGSEETKEAAGGALAVANDLANASGSPLLLGIVGVANGLFALWAGKRAAKKKDAEEWNDEDVNSLVNALRAKGFKVER